MFEQQRFIPILNEIMVEYLIFEEEATLEPVKTVNEEEIQRKNVKAKKEVEEGRKRKRTEEEEKEHSSKEEVEDFVFDEAYEVMEKKILKKGFIGEREDSKSSSHP